MAAAGISEVIHAANRGENISIIYANSASSGLDGTDNSRIKICELLSCLKQPVYIARIVATENNTKNAIEAIKKAFKLQMDNKGFAFVEILSLSAEEGNPEAKALLEEMPEKVFVDKYGVAKA